MDLAILEDEGFSPPHIQEISFPDGGATKLS